MRIRALTSIFLLAAWLVPAAGGACPSDAHEGVGHAHAHAVAAPAPTHDHASHDHAADHHGPAHAAAETRPSSDSSSPVPDEPICYARTAELPVVQAAAPDAKPRPELRTAVPSVVPPPPAASLSSAEFRRRQPPPLPYARSRRPLLI